MATPARVRGPYAKTAARREQILRTALEAFAVRGFRSSSLRDIADQVGISQAGLLHHFDSKVTLLAAVLAERDTAYEPRFHGRMDGLAVLDVLREIMVENARQPGLVRLFATLSAEATDPEHPAHAYFAIRYETIRGLLADALAKGQASGEIRPDVDVADAAAVLMAVQDGLQVQWLLNENVDMVAAFDEFLRGFRAGLEAPVRRPLVTGLKNRRTKT